MHHSGRVTLSVGTGPFNALGLSGRDRASLGVCGTSSTARARAAASTAVLATSARRAGARGDAGRADCRALSSVPSILRACPLPAITRRRDGGRTQDDPARAQRMLTPLRRRTAGRHSETGRHVTRCHSSPTSGRSTSARSDAATPCVRSTVASSNRASAPGGRLAWTRTAPVIRIARSPRVPRPRSVIIPARSGDAQCFPRSPRCTPRSTQAERSCPINEGRRRRLAQGAVKDSSAAPHGGRCATGS